MSNARTREIWRLKIRAYSNRTHTNRKMIQIIDEDFEGLAISGDETAAVTQIFKKELIRQEAKSKNTLEDALKTAAFYCEEIATPKHITRLRHRNHAFGNEAQKVCRTCIAHSLMAMTRIQSYRLKQKETK